VSSSPSKKGGARLEFREFHTPTSGLFFRASKVLCSRTSNFQKIEVFDHDFYGKVLFLDGLVQTTEKDEFYYHEMLVHPSLVCHPSPESVLIIGGGDGGALKQVLAYPVKHVTLVEIDADVIEVCREFFPWLKHCLRDKRAELVVADGNDFLAQSQRTFDVILIDSSDPVGPSAVLHHKEFFGKVKKRLKPGGVAASQSGSLLLHGATFRSKAKFLSSLFRIVRFYISPVPTYPGGTWVYNFVSESVDPLDLKREPPSGLGYYTSDIHRAAFALPANLKKIVG
jgi:spermidine synthase